MHSYTPATPNALTPRGNSLVEEHNLPGLEHRFESCFPLYR
jgi:hypothetical protein